GVQHGELGPAEPRREHDVDLRLDLEPVGRPAHHAAGDPVHVLSVGRNSWFRSFYGVSIRLPLASNANVRVAGHRIQAAWPGWRDTSPEMRATRRCARYSSVTSVSLPIASTTSARASSQPSTGDADSSTSSGRMPIVRRAPL